MERDEIKNLVYSEMKKIIGLGAPEKLNALANVLESVSKDQQREIHGELMSMQLEKEKRSVKGRELVNAQLMKEND